MLALLQSKFFTGYADENKNVPRYVHFRCGRVHIHSGLKKIGVSYKLQPSSSKQQMEYDEIIEDTWEARENERLPYVKNGLKSTALC